MQDAQFHAQTCGPVLIVGTGLLGTSIGMGLHRANVEVYLEDISPTSLMLARDMGAGEIYTAKSPAPALVIVATPPDVVGNIVCSALERFPDATVTDVASVKSQIVSEVSCHPQANRYVGSHPMAGRENSGPAAADADLFFGRAWVVIKSTHSNLEAVAVVKTLAHDLGAEVRELDAQSHDQAVAVVSHVPQLLSSILAGYLRGVDANALALAGGGLRDMTRVAASDPGMWTAISIANAKAIAQVLSDIKNSCETVITGLNAAVESSPQPGAYATVHKALLDGNEGVAKIPGKHGGAPTHTSELGVLVPDYAGELGRLFNEVGQAGFNIEDLRIEHSAGQPVGLVWISVSRDQADALASYLQSYDWRVVTA